MLSTPVALIHIPTAHATDPSKLPATSGRRASFNSSYTSTSTSNNTNINNNNNNNKNNDSTKTSPNSILISTSPKKLNKVGINLGSRKSKLAIIQSELVSDEITKIYPDLQTKITSLTTLGDQRQDKPLYSFGGKSVWTKELEVLLYESVGNYEKIDMIVHSLKDVPTNLPEGFELGCILKREDPRDVLVMKKGSPYKTLGELPLGSIVGTSSVRRSAQLLKNFPHLCFESVRGNLQTRIAKLDKPDSQYLGILLAAAGMIRSNLGHRISQYLDEDIMYHAVGQGALGIEIRAGDEYIKDICNKIRDDNSTYCCLAERSMLRYLEGGCSVPIGCVTKYDEHTKMLTMNAIVVSVDGTHYVEQSHTLKVCNDQDADFFGRGIGEKFLLNGAKLILDEIDYDRINEIKQNGVTSSVTSLLNTPEI